MFCSIVVPDPPCPAEDETLNHSLRELDAKLSVWLNAVSEAQGLLKKQTAGKAVGRRHVQTLDRPVKAKREFVDTAPIGIGTESVENAAELDHILDEILASHPRVAAGHPLSQEEEDKCLLASLDTQTKQQVRINRRLCLGSKSVRELVHEVRATQEHEQQHVSRFKSWWTKGKG